MANTLFPKGKQRMLTAGVNFLTDTIKAVLVPDSYVFSAAHEFLSDLGTTFGAAQTLTNKSVTDGVFDADDVTFPALTAGTNLKAVVLYKDTGVAGSSPVLDYVDTVTGLPMLTNNGDVQIQWDGGGYRIFSL